MSKVYYTPIYLTANKEDRGSGPLKMNFVDTHVPKKVRWTYTSINQDPIVPGGRLVVEPQKERKEVPELREADKETILESISQYVSLPMNKRNLQPIGFLAFCRDGNKPVLEQAFILEPSGGNRLVERYDTLGIVNPLMGLPSYLASYEADKETQERTRQALKDMHGCGAALFMRDERGGVAVVPVPPSARVATQGVKGSETVEHKYFKNYDPI